jgi:hypothetical protein
MRLPPQTLSKYLGRLDDLIAEGEAVPVREVSVPARVGLRGETRYKQVKEVAWPGFVEWRTKCQTLLGQVIPLGNVHRETAEKFNLLNADTGSLQFGIAFLKAIRKDLQDGFLDSLASHVESELAADYLAQAERLLEDGATRQFTHVPAAVLSGAVLEKGLRSLCQQLGPPEPTTNAAGQPLGMARLIDALKGRGVFNELTAKQLRAWADIRNNAAHGNVTEFTREQADAMVSGIGDFLRRYL